MGRFRALILPWAVFLIIAVVIGCSNGGDGDTELEDRGARVGNVVLNPRTFVVPSDGSVIATAIGENGIQLRGIDLSWMSEGDYIIATVPVTDEARRRVNHTGGFAALTQGWHIVPLEMMPEKFITPGTSSYDYFVIHFGQIARKAVNPGPLAAIGAKAASSDVVDDSVFGFVSRAASGVTHIATKGISDVTNAVTNVASDVTSSVSKAASDVDSAAQSLGPIDEVVSTVETFGMKFSQVVKQMDLETEKLLTDPKGVYEDVKNFGEFLVTGNSTVTVGQDGTYTINLDNVSSSVAVGQETLSASLSGTIAFSYSEQMTVSIRDYQPSSVRYYGDFNYNADVTFHGARGSISFPIKTINLDPIVVDAGIPVVLIPEIDITADFGSNATSAFTVSSTANTSFDATVTTSTVFGRASLSPSGTISIPKKIQSSADAAIHIKPSIKLYDTAGPYLDITAVQATLTPSTDKVSSVLSSAVTLGAELDGIGYPSFSKEKQLTSITWATIDTPFPAP